MRLTRRFIGWVWHTDHDDRVPNVVNGTMVVALVMVMIVGATSVWLILGLVAVFMTAVLSAQVSTPPVRRPGEQGRLDDSASLSRSLHRGSGGRP